MPYHTRKFAEVWLCQRERALTSPLIFYREELGWPISQTLPPSQSWQQHYCYWPLLFLPIFSSTGWNNTTDPRCCDSSKPIHVCGQSVIIRCNYSFLWSSLCPQWINDDKLICSVRMCGPYGVTQFGFWSENFTAVVFVSGFQPAEGDSTQQTSRDANQTTNLTDQSSSFHFIFI